MLQVEFNKKQSNPFYGMKNTLSIFQNASKGMSINKATLSNAWDEADTPERLALLFSVLFFVGDVTNRQHNLFEGKVDNGGNSQREIFRDEIIPSLVSKVSTLNQPARLNLIRLIVEYTTLDNVVGMRVKTAKKTKKVLGVINMKKVFGIEDVSTYVAGIISKGTLFEKVCVAKFITRPRFSKRSGKTQMLPETKEIMKQRSDLLMLISDKAGLSYTVKDKYVNFEGFYKWRQEFNQDFESVLFSTGFVNSMDKEQFIGYVNKIPSDARFRVRNRVLFNDKWSKLKPWFIEWEQFKMDKQAEQRKLENKIEQGTASEDDIFALKKVKKEASVNVGANSFTGMFTDIINGRVDEVKLQPFLDKIKLPYNTLVFVDDSGSMDSNWSSNGLGFTARQIAAFIATIVLSKNPDVEARDLVGLFSRDCRLYNGINSYNVAPNALLRKNVVETALSPLIQPEDTFLNNLRRFKSFLDSKSTSNGTDVSSIVKNLAIWVGNDPNRLEELQRYPIWTLISDGNFNNSHSAEASLNDMLKQCENTFGFRPYIIIIDVAGNSSSQITQFQGIDNVMMVPPNPAAIEMFLTNFKDMDTYDVYTPLLSLSRSNRYAPVREFIKNVKNSF